MNDTPPPAEIPNTTDQMVQLKMAYYQAKICYGLSLVFVLCGFFVFAGVYARRIAPDPLAALRDVSTIGMVVAMFLPALFLSFLARRYEKKYMAMRAHLSAGP